MSKGRKESREERFGRIIEWPGKDKMVTCTKCNGTGIITAKEEGVQTKFCMDCMGFGVVITKWKIDEGTD